MTFPVSHKTVFVLDHSSYFAESCRQPIEFDVFTQKRQPGIIPLAPICKSLWTCTVEGVVEYCRTVWDIYPREKLIRFITCDAGARSLNSWNVAEQNVQFLMNHLATVGPPGYTQSNAECNIMHGLSAAIEALCQCSDIQHEKRTSFTDIASRVVNRGRVICLTNLRNDSYAKGIENCFAESIIQHNNVAAGTDNLIPIHYCELLLIHTYPNDCTSNITEKPKREVSPLVGSEIRSIVGGRNLSTRLYQLVLRHYDLASTTVTGIPMKEEQNAHSSANYDVELLHAFAAHGDIIKFGGTADGLSIRSMKEGADYETVTLKWCTPRLSATEMQPCAAMFRITPMDVNSRPSSCLTNFLLSGRAVMLEMPRKSGSKVMSHMLSSHGGEIFIHSLVTGRSTLEDPPSISEGCGGRVTDYRINDLGELMKMSKLMPTKKMLEGNVPPIIKAQRHLERLTRYWPMVISNTTIFNLTQVLEPLLSLIVNETLTDGQVVECKKVIYNLIGMDSRNDALSIPSMGTRGKGPKREELYRIVWKELESFIRLHCNSDAHNRVLDCLLTCHKSFPESPSKSSNANDSGSSSTSRKSGDKTSIKEEISEDGTLQRKEQKYHRLSDAEKSDSGNQDMPDLLKLKRPDTPPLKRQKLNLRDDRGKLSSNTSVLQLWTNKLNTEYARRHNEISGRLTSEGNIGKLYANLSDSQET
ncbi:hypothetical protein CHUAL_005402 [Chamberlinius hualienensis]